MIWSSQQQNCCVVNLICILQVAKALTDISDRLVPLREPTLIYNRRMDASQLDHPDTLLGMNHGYMFHLSRGETLKKYLSHMIAQTLKDADAHNATGNLTKEQLANVTNSFEAHEYGGLQGTEGTGKRMGVCGDKLKHWVESNHLDRYRVLPFASVHEFMGFYAGSKQDKVYREALTVLGAEQFYRTCA